MFFATASTISHFLLEMYILVILLLPDKTSVRYSSCTVCHRPMKEASNRAAYWGKVCYIFSKRSGARCSPQGRKIAQKIPSTMHGGQLWRVVAQSENFVETYESPHLKRLSSCARTYHAMGYKLYPWGARAPQSCPIDLLW